MGIQAVKWPPFCGWGGNCKKSLIVATLEKGEGKNLDDGPPLFLLFVGVASFSFLLVALEAEIARLTLGKKVIWKRG